MGYGLMTEIQKIGKSHKIDGIITNEGLMPIHYRRSVSQCKEFPLIRISSRSMHERFQGCSKEYILEYCKGRCCRSTSTESGTRIPVTKNDIERFKNAKIDVTIVDNYIMPRSGERRCPFHLPSGLCALHGTPYKPLGCIVSPFALNKNSTLIIRHRYRRLKCYKAPPGREAFDAYRVSLEAIFGIQRTDWLIRHLRNGGGDVFVETEKSIFDQLVEREIILRGNTRCQYISYEEVAEE